MNIKIYLDGADLDAIEKHIHRCDGLTTNPALMRKAGITDYRTFAREVLDRADGKPVSFEVLSDTTDEMEKQAHMIAGWGDNVLVKIPIMRTCGKRNLGLIHRLSSVGIRVNVTAVMSVTDAVDCWASMEPASRGIVSIFAGRIADTGVDPEPIIKRAKTFIRSQPPTVLWASAREVFNVVQAERCGADIITLSPELLTKLSLFGKNLNDYSAETVQMFVNDAKGITL